MENLCELAAVFLKLHGTRGLALQGRGSVTFLMGTWLSWSGLVT